MLYLAFIEIVMNKNQVTNTILMIRPSNFGYNPVTALDNLYQKKDTSISSLVIAQKAQYEFDNFVDKLQHHGIKVIQFLTLRNRGNLNHQLQTMNILNMSKKQKIIVKEEMFFN